MQLFIKTLRRDIANPDLQDGCVNSLLSELFVQSVHEQGADFALAGFRDNIQGNHVSACGSLHARQNESKNPAKPLGHPCYAFRVIEMISKSRLGKCDILVKADPVDPVQRFEVVCLIVANP